MNQELTTQAAANMLTVSLPYLLQLLEEGAIPYTGNGADLRIRRDDVLDYRQARDEARRQKLAELTKFSQELGLYDE